MKKIMIACVAVVMAAVAQAASVDWSFSEIAMNSKNPLDLTTSTAYLFTESAWSTFTSLDAKDRTLENFKGYLDSAAITSAAQGSTRTKFETGTQTTEGSSGNFYIVLSDGKGYVASSALAATAYSSATEQYTPASWGISAGATPLASSDFTEFATADVPEPTSGLLLLLGVAGLALRRRRA